jgi:N6-adenosine-specific RNA methylase IME4
LQDVAAAPAPQNIFRLKKLWKPTPIRESQNRRGDSEIIRRARTVGLAKGGQPYQEKSTGLPDNPVATLASQGIDKNLAHEARKLGGMTEEEFEQQVEEAREYVAYGKREILEKSKEIRAVDRADNYAIWTARTTALSNANAPLPSDRQYPIIYADPPWKFEVYDSSSGLDSAAAAHYPTMETEDICALPVADLATRDAALFLWVTSPILEEALSVLRAWGFEYKTNIAWVKHAPGLGYWVRNQHELLLIGSRGKMRTPPEGIRRPPSIIDARRREHSRKPDEARAVIELMYPELPKIELFARGEGRPGWATWGNEAGEVA